MKFLSCLQDHDVQRNRISLAEDEIIRRGVKKPDSFFRVVE